MLARDKHLRDSDKTSPRVLFCKRHIYTKVHNWVFLDAKFVYLCREKQRYAHNCWQQVGEDLVTLPLSSPTVLLFHGSEARGFRSQLHVVAPTPALGSKARNGKENFNSTRCIAVLEKLKAELSAWFCTRPYHIIRDYAKQHTSRKPQLLLWSGLGCLFSLATEQKAGI